MYWATLETRNFSFTAFDYTPDAALETMRITWEVHATQTGATLTWGELVEDVNIVSICVGDGWRDYDRLIFTTPTRESEK